MTTNCSYGKWNPVVSKYSLTVEQGVEGALNGEYTDEQIQAVSAAYRDAINAALPDSVSLCGDEFYGPYNTDDDQFAGFPLCNLFGEPSPPPPWADPKDTLKLDINSIVDGVDFWAIVEKETAK